MRLPNAQNAKVEREKITGYLLNAKHPYGSSKASFFTRFGFELEKWELLAEALREQGRRHPISREYPSEIGLRYDVEGPIITPDGRHPNIHTVWQMNRGELAPRLITAYPAGDSK